MTGDGDRDLAIAHVASTVNEADLVVGLLRSNGIKAIVDEEDAVVMLDAIASGNKGIKVVVPRGEEGRAKSIVEDAKAGGDLSKFTEYEEE